MNDVPIYVNYEPIYAWMLQHSRMLSSPCLIVHSDDDAAASG